MVSGLTPPSRRKDLNDAVDKNEALREIVPYIPDSRNDQVSGSLFGQSSLSVPNILGQFAITPYEAVESVMLKLTASTSNAIEIQIGDKVTTSANGWEGVLVFIEDEQVPDGSYATGITKTYLFEPTTNTVFSDTNQTISMQTIADDPRNEQQSDSASQITITFSYSSGNAVTGGIALNTSTIVAKRFNPSDNNVEIKNIYGGISHGTIITVKPLNGKTLTLKTGGNIDIASDVTVDDNEFVLLQFFDDTNETSAGERDGGYYVLLSGAGTLTAGANTTLSNLADPTSINQDLLPNLTAGSVDGDSNPTDQNLGSSSKVWADLYVKTIYNTGTIKTESGDHEMQFYTGGGQRLAVSDNATSNAGYVELFGVSSSTNEPEFKTVSTDATPTVGDFIGGFTMDGYNSATERTTYARINSKITSKTNSAEGGKVEINIMDGGGNLDSMFEVNNSGILLPTTSHATPSTDGSIYKDSSGNIKVRTGGSTKSLSDIGGSGSTSFIGFEADANLDMNTRDINGLDRLLFSTEQSSQDDLGNTDWGIEAYDDGTGNYGDSAHLGLQYQVPSAKNHKFKVHSSDVMTIDSTNTTFATDIIPNSAGGKNLGSLTNEWNTLFLSNGLYFGFGQQNSTLYNTSGMKFSVTDSNDWYEFRIDNDYKFQIKNDRIVSKKDILPFDDEVLDLGSSAYEWHDIWGKTLQGVSYVDFESTGMKISNSSNDLDVRVATSQDINFKFLDGSTTSTEFKVSEQGIQLYQNSTPSSLQNGQIWYDGTDIKARTGGSTKSLSDIGGSSGGGAIQRYQLYNSTSSNSELEMWHCSSHTYGSNGDGMSMQTLTQYKIYWQPLMIPVACKLQFVGLWSDGNNYSNGKYDVGLYSNGGSGSNANLLYPYQRLAQETDVFSHNEAMADAETAGDWNYSLDAGLYWLAVLPVGNDVTCANIAPKWMQSMGFYYESTSKNDSPVTSGATVGYYKTGQTTLPATAPDELDRRYSAQTGWEPAIFCRFKS